LGVGVKLDQLYHGKELPGKFKMAVSGCRLSCAESWVRDIGLIGQKDGWTLVVGGNVGANPRIAQVAAEGLDDEGMYAAIEKVLGFYTKKAKKGERIGKMLGRIGLEGVKAAVA